MLIVDGPVMMERAATEHDFELAISVEIDGKARVSVARGETLRVVEVHQQLAQLIVDAGAEDDLGRSARIEIGEREGPVTGFEWVVGVSCAQYAAIGSEERDDAVCIESDQLR